MEETNNIQEEYIIYVRKSSEESTGKQKQSIPDQISACIHFAQTYPLGQLKIAKKPAGFSSKYGFETDEDLRNEENDIDNRDLYLQTRSFYIVKEDHSATEPHGRAKRNKIISLIQKGEIKGLISYSPDRQARNMVDGGEIIHLAHKMLVDLKYTNFSFVNNAGGRMMLGVWFVFSKQYSDKLSEDISRGLKNRVNAGKSMGVQKYGYSINEDGYHYPNEQYFNIMKKAFHKRIYDKETNLEIAKWLEAYGFYRFYKGGKINESISSKRLSEVWKDPFYYGKFVYGDSECDLREVSEYYEPMITEAEYEVLCMQYKASKTRLGQSNERQKDVIKPLPDGMVIAYNGDVLNHSVPNINGRYVTKLEKLKITNPEITLADVVKPHNIRYRCTLRHRESYGLSVSFVDIDKMIGNKLKKLSLSDDLYTNYKDATIQKMHNINIKNREKTRIIELQISVLRKRRDQFEEENVFKTQNNQQIKKYNEKINKYEQQINLLTEEKKNIESKRKIKVEEYKVFMDILQNAYQIYQSGDYVRKCQIVKIFFSNIIVNKQKKLTVKVKPGLEDMFLKNSSSGADDATRTRNILLGKEVH